MAEDNSLDPEMTSLEIEDCIYLESELDSLYLLERDEVSPAQYAKKFMTDKFSCSGIYANIIFVMLPILNASKIPMPTTSFGEWHGYHHNAWKRNKVTTRWVYPIYI